MAMRKSRKVNTTDEVDVNALKKGQQQFDVGSEKLLTEIRDLKKTNNELKLHVKKLSEHETKNKELTKEIESLRKLNSDLEIKVKELSEPKNKVNELAKEIEILKKSNDDLEIKVKELSQHEIKNKELINDIEKLKIKVNLSTSNSNSKIGIDGKRLLKLIEQESQKQNTESPIIGRDDMISAGINKGRIEKAKKQVIACGIVEIREAKNENNKTSNSFTIINKEI